MAMFGLQKVHAEFMGRKLLRVVMSELASRSAHRSFSVIRTYMSVNRRERGAMAQCKNCDRLHPANFSHSSTTFSKVRTVLGIETSCDDTGAAIVSEDGRVIGEALHSQTAMHNKTGGIIPNVAKELHAQNVESVVQKALESANMSIQDVDAIAVTVKPGLVMSLHVGLKYAQKLALMTSQQLIPIHHMEAHALTARMIEPIEFPFLVLLASGGHCLLAVARDIDDFLLLGSSQDIAPGEAYDKVARELRLTSMPQFSGLCGGLAIELLAREGDHTAYPPVFVMAQQANCNFSFAGLKMSAKLRIMQEYKRLGLSTDEVLPNAADICAWFQQNVLYHLVRRLQRAFIFSEMDGLLGETKTLVLSGGVASNSYIRSNLQHICSLYNCRLVCPPQKLCTDNGIMIAWNGVEKFLSGRNYFQHGESLDVQARSPFGVDISKKVTNCSIKLPKLILPQVECQSC